MLPSSKADGVAGPSTWDLTEQLHFAFPAARADGNVDDGEHLDHHLNGCHGAVWRIR